MGIAFKGIRNDAIEEMRQDDPEGAAKLESAYAREANECWLPTIDARTKALEEALQVQEQWLEEIMKSATSPTDRLVQRALDALREARKK